MSVVSLSAFIHRRRKRPSETPDPLGPGWTVKPWGGVGSGQRQHVPPPIDWRAVEIAQAEANAASERSSVRVRPLPFGGEPDPTQMPEPVDRRNPRAIRWDDGTEAPHWNQKKAG